MRLKSAPENRLFYAVMNHEFVQKMFLRDLMVLAMAVDLFFFGRAGLCDERTREMRHLDVLLQMYTTRRMLGQNCC